ncbi:hypothetical protein U6B65_09155 [Oscillospiraceae bacterium MB08-C2-2]|nr:hypothetical protein U6B65_09155 [Oscillospiraceae bacterium MB08-C2-2]
MQKSLFTPKRRLLPPFFAERLRTEPYFHAPLPGGGQNNPVTLQGKEIFTISSEMQPETLPESQPCVKTDLPVSRSELKKWLVRQSHVMYTDETHRIRVI